MRFAVIDTESNGLFVHRDARGGVVRSDAEGQPRMAAFAMILLNEDFSVQDQYVTLIKPDGWKMTPEATAINNLTDEMLAENGKPIAEVMQVFTRVVREGFAIAAFNVQHDLRLCRGELRRAGMDDLFQITKNFCCMRKSNGPIPKADGKKGWPKLSEAKAFLMAKGLLKDATEGEPHSALHDAQVCVAILRFLKSEGIDLTPEVHYAREPKPGQAPPPSPSAPVDMPASAGNEEIPT